MLQTRDQVLDLDGWHRRPTVSPWAVNTTRVAGHLLQRGLLLLVLCLFWGLILYVVLTSVLS